MAERLAVIAAVGVIAELPCAAVLADAQDQARHAWSYHSPAARYGIETVVSFFDGISQSGFGCNLGAAGPLCHGMPGLSRE